MLHQQLEITIDHRPTSVFLAVDAGAVQIVVARDVVVVQRLLLLLLFGGGR